MLEHEHSLLPLITYQVQADIVCRSDWFAERPEQQHINTSTRQCASPLSSLVLDLVLHLPAQQTTLAQVQTGAFAAASPLGRSTHSSCHPRSMIQAKHW